MRIESVVRPIRPQERLITRATAQAISAHAVPNRFE